MLVDTHCHIHESYDLPIDEVLAEAYDADVAQLICVGTSEESSRLAVAFAKKHPEAYAAIGVHPHDTKGGYGAIPELAAADPASFVAVGEIGLDYFYTHSDRETQITALHAQIQVAISHDKPIIFHVREAFNDFWPIFEQYSGIRGVLHSFTDSKENMLKAVSHGLYIGVNGISTFTKDEAQQAMFDAIPLDKLIFETDAPFLTPTPYRGKINQPAYVRLVAEFHAQRRGIALEAIAEQTTHNARTLFSLTV
jgi:TatD DNase family protein